MNDSFDDRARQALFDSVHVPHGLEERLLAFLANQSDPANPSDQLHPSIRRERPHRQNRRRLVVASLVGLACVASVIGLVRFMLHQPMDQSAVVAELREVDAKLGPWKQMSEFTEQEQYPVPQPLRSHVHVSQWQAVTSGKLGAGVVFQVQGRGVAARLFAFNSAARRVVLVDSVPQQPNESNASGQTVSMGVWEAGDRVYGLAVDGGTAEYNRLVWIGVAAR
ncbi:MAG: hypothetical protein R3E01_26425 [Pirellulaceae bacterium]|nr:hypothetical protein [Planctomycetales bacterium]